MTVGVVGCGMIGSTSAYALVMSGVGREIVWSQAMIAGLSLEEFEGVHGTPLTGHERRAYRGERPPRGVSHHRPQGRDLLRHRQRGGAHRRRPAARPARHPDRLCPRITDVAGCDGVTLALPHVIGGAGVLATIPVGP